MTRFFRKQLVATILPVLLLAALTTLWLTQGAERALVNQLRSEMNAECRVHAAAMSAYFERRLAELRTMAATPLMQQEPLAPKLAYLSSEKRRLGPLVESLYFNDIDGNVSGIDGETFQVRDRNYFPQVQQGREVITPPLVSRATGRQVVLVIVPIFNDRQERLGAVAESIELATLFHDIEAILPRELGFAAIVDSQGRILTPNRPASPRREQLQAWLQDNADAQSAELLLDGETFLLERVGASTPDWQLVLAKRRALALQPAVRLRTFNLVVAGMALAVAFVIAYFSARRLLRPLAVMVDAQRRFGQGDWSARCPDLSNDELGELGKAFNQTADLLAARHAAEAAAEVELRASEARFRLLFDNIGDAIFLHDMQGKILDVNPAACESLGYSREELLQLTIAEIVTTRNAEQLDALWHSLVSGGKRLTGIEGGHRRKDGSTFPVEVALAQLTTPGGVLLLASARDVTQRQRDANAINKFFRLATDMLCITDSHGVFKLLSPAFEQVLGYSAGELIGQRYIDFVHPDDRERTSQEGQRLLRGEGPVTVENRYRCRDGSYKWLQWRPFRELDDGMIYAIARDVDDSHRLTRLMKETSHAARIGGWELDFVTGDLFWTDETYALHETSPANYRPTLSTAIAFYAPESQPLIRAAVEKASRDGSSWSLELELITAKGNRIWAHALGRVELDQGKPARAFGVFQDITERKLADAERKRLDAELGELQRVESIGILAGGIAHDFNNLLTGILGFTRLAMSEATHNPRLVAQLEQIEECSLRAAELCKQLLAYAGRGKFDIETIDLSELVRDTSRLVESIVKQQAILRLELDPYLPRIEGDATQMRQVVMNLITNAVDALEGRAGNVVVRTGVADFQSVWLEAARVRSELPAGRHVFFEVADDGVGMTAETMARIFDPFFTTKFTGRGLGLAAVQGIIRRHHGAIGVQSMPGTGTIITVVLPMAQGETEQESPAKREPAPSSAAPIERSANSLVPDKRMVLVIDDEPAVAALARTALERGGYSVVSAPEGPSGVVLFQEHQASIAAVLVDMTMPGMDGLQVVRSLRELDRDVPLLLMSGYAEIDLSQQAGELHLSGFVSKPFKLSELQATVDKATGTQRLEGEAPHAP